MARSPRTHIVPALLGAAGSFAAYRLVLSESQLFGRTLVSGRNPKEWALTYDDGPNPQTTPALLELLARFDVPATFFMIGKFVRQHPELVRRVHAAGHVVGNHTMTHPFLATKPMSVVSREIRDCNALLQDTLGAPVRFFRAPFGARRPGILRFLRREGLVPVQWNVQGNDWEPIGTEGILGKVAAGLARAQKQGRGANILLHDGFDEKQGYDRTPTVEATEALLRNAAILRNAGINFATFVTVDAWATREAGF